TRLGPLISAIGASIFLQNAVMLSQGARMKVYMTSLLFPRTWRIQIAGASVSLLVIVMIVVAGLMMWGLHLLVQRTKLGRSIRAVAEDRKMATIMGVNVRRVIAVTFFPGSALGGAGGVLVGLYYTQIDFFMGYSAGVTDVPAAGWRARMAWALGAVAFGGPLAAPNDYWIGVMARICLYATLALGLNIVVGFAGLLDLGYVAFFGIGSYLYAFLASTHFGLH